MADIKAPAKINLTLEVLGKRPDGFHEIRSVIQTIDLYDTLRFSPDRHLRFSSDNPDFVAQKSLVSQAADMLRELSGSSLGAAIEIEKRIPLVAGLGGDSSAAAAVLGQLNRLWGLGLSPSQLVELAPRLGSDVPFFLYGGTALVEGRGEEVTELPPLPPHWVVLLVPPIARVSRKTARLYASLKPGHYTDGQITERLVKALRDRRGFKPSLLFNTFENTAFDFFPGLETFRDHFIKLGADSVHLAGSGPALFALLDDRLRAEDLYARCWQQGLECYLSRTL